MRGTHANFGIEAVAITMMHQSCEGIPRSSVLSVAARLYGLRDFSPGARATSAIRPPFSATQEFFVIGYLSV
jgi:hypothetical protein